MKHSIFSGALLAACVAIGGQASAQGTTLNTDRIDAYINKFGDREEVAKSVHTIERTNLFLNEEPKDQFAALRTALGLIETLAEQSETPEGAAAGAMLSLAQKLVPEAPDLYLFHLKEIETAINELNNAMIAGFERLAAQDDRNALDTLATNKIGDIDGAFGTYLDFLENLERAEEQGLDDVVTTDLLTINGVTLNTATGELAKLCAGTKLLGGQNIFDAHLRETDGDVMGAIAIGQYLLHKIVFAQKAHSGRIFYDDKDISPEAIDNAMDIAEARHRAHFETCHDRLSEMIEDIHNRRKSTLRPYIVPFLKNWDGSMKASTLGKELHARMPMLEWTVISYEHVPNSGDKKDKNWIGDHYIKVKIDPRKSSLGDHWVIVSWRRPTDEVLTDSSGCAAKIDEFNAKTFKTFERTGVFGGRPRDFLPMLCPGIDETTHFAWASKRTGATVWSSDPLSFSATQGENLKRRTKFYVKYALVGLDQARCSRQQPNFGTLSGIGGSSNRALFVDGIGNYYKYSKNSDGKNNCFLTRPLPMSMAIGPDVDDIGISGILDTDWLGTSFDRPGEGWSANFLLLDDGTYRTSSSDLGSESSEVRIGKTSERFQGITDAQAEMIVGATAVPSLNNLYFFFSDGTYSRYSVSKERVDFGPHPIDQGWPGVRADGIVGVAEFEETNNAIYFFHEDGSYQRYSVSLRRVDFENESAAAIWR